MPPASIDPWSRSSTTTSRPLRNRAMTMRKCETPRGRNFSLMARRNARCIALRCAVVMAALSSLVAGCARETPEGREQMKYVDEETDRVNLPALRRDIMVVQRELAFMGDAASIVGILEPADGVLMSCSKGRHQWTGSTTVEYAEAPEQEAYFALVESRLADSVDFRTERLSTPDGKDEWLIVWSKDGTRYSITVYSGRSKVQVSSSSWCFTVQPGQTDHGRF